MQFQLYQQGQLPKQSPKYTYKVGIQNSSINCSQFKNSIIQSQKQRQKSNHSYGKQGNKTKLQPQAMFGGFNPFKSDPGEKTRQLYQNRVNDINKFENSVKQLSDQQLQQKTKEFQNRIQNKGEKLENILPEVFAVAREASMRVLGLRPFDVQLIGAMILHEGQIAEMKTGEGKTLVAVLPAYLNALTGKPVHIVTVNDYLARRDSEWVGQVHRFLGLKVGLIQQGMENTERQQAYKCDITYVTNSELGFDYLRDNLAQRKEDLVLREFNFCIIDEVDSILVDEARTPLIISGSAEPPSQKYEVARKVAEALARDVHYTVDEKQKNAIMTDKGYEAVEDVLQVRDLYDPLDNWATFITNALKAKELFKRDVNYIVRNDEVVIVDEFTGRIMPGRKWSEGLHQSIDCKEGVPISEESRTLASITYQNFFRSFPKLSGMTGTAATEANEFASIYNLTVSVVPTNKKNQRKDRPDVVFRSEPGKWKAVVEDIVEQQQAGRPVLVGTTSVEKSELLAKMLSQKGVSYQVLNAKPENVEKESEIIAQSGRLSQITIATNMAGRGTDIILGGNSEFMARLQLRQQLLPHIVSEKEDPNVVRTPNSAFYRGFQSDPALFPIELSQTAQNKIDEAVQFGIKTWGEKSVPESKAYYYLSIASEKQPIEDEALMKLREAFNAIEKEYKEYCDQAKAKVVSQGGLHVVGTERHESRRIDNQLRGRTARQGDDGSTRFFLSMEDTLFRVFGGDRMRDMMKNLGLEDVPIESGMVTNSLDQAQRKVENFFFDTRKQLFEYDQVLNSQREKIYSERRKALYATDLDQLMVEYAEKTAEDVVRANIDIKKPRSEWKFDDLAQRMTIYCPGLFGLSGQTLKDNSSDFETLLDFTKQLGVGAYYQKVKDINKIEPTLMSEAIKAFLLLQIDLAWRQHLEAIQFLRQAVGLRGYGQKDPLTEYKLEAYNLFIDMLVRVRRNVIYSIYVFQPQQIDDMRRQTQQIEQENADANPQGQETDLSQLRPTQTTRVGG